MSPFVRSILILFIPAFLQAQQWSQWRGPNDNWQVIGSKLNPQSLNTPRILWRTQAGTGHAAVAIQDGWLYTVGQNDSLSNDSTTVEALSCLDAANGRLIWKKEFASRQFQYHGPGSTPTLLDDRLYYIQRNGTVRVLDRFTGREYWQRTLASDSLTGFNPWGICSSIVIDGNRLFINAGRAGICLDRDSGKTLWHNGSGMPGNATPVLFHQQGREMVAVQTYDSLYAIHRRSGSVEWAICWQSDAEPLVLGDRLYISGCKNKGEGCQYLDISGNRPRMIWKAARSRYSFCPVLLKDSTAFTRTQKRSGDFILTAFNMHTGSINWQKKVGTWGSMIMADGHLVVITGEGVVKIIRADPQHYSEVSQISIYTDNDLSEFRLKQQKRRTCWTAPIIADGRLYVRDTWGELVCLDVSS